jgi:hypothetical protein
MANFSLRHVLRIHISIFWLRRVEALTWHVITFDSGGWWYSSQSLPSHHLIFDVGLQLQKFVADHWPCWYPNSDTNPHRVNSNMSPIYPLYPTIIIFNPHDIPAICSGVKQALMVKPVAGPPRDLLRLWPDMTSSLKKNCGRRDAELQRSFVNMCECYTTSPWIFNLKKVHWTLWMSYW